MSARFFASALLAAGLAGCAGGYTPPPPSSEPGPAHMREIQEGRPGVFGDLRWTVDLSSGRTVQGVPGGPTAQAAAEMEEYKRWKDSVAADERKEFEEWRAWQEWKRKNPK